MASIKDIPIAERFAKPEAYFKSDRSEVLSFLPTGTRKVLDIGCGAAQTWVDQKDLEVWGVERDPGAAAIARQHLARVFSSDVDGAMPELLKEKFDVIFLADVLEHLTDPWGLLLKLNGLLGTQGRLLLSIPNFGHYRILKRIIFRKEFRYAQEGILDVDHLRFFCKKDVEWMLAATGYRIEKFSRKYSATKFARILNAVTFGLLDDLLTEQFFILARKA